MKKIRLIIAIVTSMLTYTVANAQTETATDSVIIPESYMETQDQLPVDTTMGTATYNIDGEAPPVDPGAASFRSEGEVEELRIYSGSHDGNNVIKTVQMRVPVRNQDPYAVRSTYTPE